MYLHCCNGNEVAVTSAPPPGVRFKISLTDIVDCNIMYMSGYLALL